MRGLAAHDDLLAADTLLLWNFSDPPADVTLTATGLPPDRLFRHTRLDAVTPLDDETTRLRPLSSGRTPSGQPFKQAVHLEPHGVQAWSFEPPF